MNDKFIHFGVYFFLTVQKECQGLVTVIQSGPIFAVFSRRSFRWIPLIYTCTVYPNLRLHQHFTVCVFILALKGQWNLMEMSFCSRQSQVSKFYTNPTPHTSQLYFFIYFLNSQIDTAEKKEST